MRVLVTRPEPAAHRTAERLRNLGHAPVVAPLLVPRAVAWTCPDILPDAIVFTSAMAPALGGANLARLTGLPIFAVGDATADAARAAGFGTIRAARGDATAVFAAAARAGHRRLLQLAGADRSPAVIAAGVEVDVVTVYEAALAPALPPFEADIVLLYSTRTAAHFAVLFTGDRATLHLAALSQQVADAAGPGWAHVAVAVEPTEDALFAAAGLTCE